MSKDRLAKAAKKRGNPYADKPMQKLLQLERRGNIGAGMEIMRRLEAVKAMSTKAAL